MRINPATFSFNKPKGFLVVEGVNGAGKSSFIKNLTDYLKDFFPELKTTREPGGSDLGIELRKIIMSDHFKLKPLSETLLFLADRHQHVETIIKPHLENKIPIISDRYYYSTLAFQGYGRGLDLALLTELNLKITNNTLPDLVILLDLDPATGLQRTKTRNSSEKDSFELEELNFHEKLRNGFLDLSNKLPDAFLKVIIPGIEMKYPRSIIFLAKFKS